MRLFILTLSAGCLLFYGYALAGYASYSFGRGRPDYVGWGLAAGTLCAAAALSLWKRWVKDNAPDLLVFDVDGVLVDMGGTAGTAKNWKDMGKPVGIYTGRSRAEAALALSLLNWTDFPRDMLVTCDDGITKPSPAGLATLCERSGARNPIFFGDSPMDKDAWAAFGKGNFVAIGPMLKSQAARGEFIHFDTLEEALSLLL